MAMAIAPLCASSSSSSQALSLSSNLITFSNFSTRARLLNVGTVYSAQRSPSILRVQASTDAVDEPERDTLDEPQRDTLVVEFMRYVNAAQQSWPYEGRRPTALMPPNTVVKVQMDSLMRNDWPDDDSGIRTAFQFSMPANVEEMLGGQVPKSVSTARAWDAAERYLTLSEFSAALRDSMYAPLINCLDWKVASPVVFHGPGDLRALQCVNVKYQSLQGTEASRAYTFCLQKVKQGAYQNCWMIVGVRLGDYANV